MKCPERGFTRRFSIKNGKGFTRIELLVVIAIIILLASVVFASLSTVKPYDGIRSAIIE